MNNGKCIILWCQCRGFVKGSEATTVAGWSHENDNKMDVIPIKFIHTIKTFFDRCKVGYKPNLVPTTQYAIFKLNQAQPSKINDPLS